MSFRGYYQLDVRDRLTEIPPFSWVKASYQCYKLFDVADWPYYYIIYNYKRFFSPPEISVTQFASLKLASRYRMDDPG